MRAFNWRSANFTPSYGCVGQLRRIKALTTLAHLSPNHPSVESGKWRDEDSNGRHDAGEYVYYSIIVANEGTVTLSAVEIADTSGSVICSMPDSGLLEQGAHSECNAFRQVRYRQSCVSVRQMFAFYTRLGSRSLCVFQYNGFIGCFAYIIGICAYSGTPFHHLDCDVVPFTPDYTRGAEQR